MKTVLLGYVGAALSLVLAAFLVLHFLLPHRYAVDFASGGPLGASIVLTVPCSQQPHSWKDAAAYCNIDDVEAHVVPLDVYDHLHQGDQYPS